MHSFCILALLVRWSFLLFVFVIREKTPLNVTKKSLDDSAMSKLCPYNTPVWLAMQLLTLFQSTEVRLRNPEWVSRDHSRPFCTWSVQESNRTATSISQVGEITKLSPKRTHCQLWVCLFDW